MKQKLADILASIARRILHKYKPKIVGITGSHGKTSTREAVFAALSGKYTVRRSMHNYNNEFGVPLAIMGLESPGKNIFSWLGILIKGFWMAYAYTPFPQVLVLEMAVDRPQDMDFLISIAQPDVAVLTSIGLSHLKYFGTQEKILEEKSKIFHNIGRQGCAVLNIDDQRIKTFMPNIHGKIITYGFDPGADVRVMEYSITYGRTQKSFGVLFKLQYKGTVCPVFLSGVVGVPHIMACAAGAAVAISMGLSLADACKPLENYQSEPGRLRLIEGQKKSILIDDTYNSAPASVAAALYVLHEFPSPGKIAVLGDMLELGHVEDQAHADIAKLLVGYSFDYVLGVGPLMKKVIDELRMHPGFGSRVMHFDDSEEAGKNLVELLGEGATVLIKGSQGMRMERTVKMAMAEPQKAPELLCRQDESWLKK